MYRMRESWSDERLDDFRDEVNRRFDGVNRRFDKVDAELHRVNDRLDGLHRTLLQIAGGTIATLIAGFAGVIATQL
jgi:hypothetical protein